MLALMSIYSISFARNFPLQCDYGLNGVSP